MAESNGNDLNLERILQTLANFSSAPNVAQQDQQAAAPVHPITSEPYSLPQAYQSNQASLPYDPSVVQDPRLQNRPAPQHREPPPRPQSSASTPVIDPATITEWKHGIRCVSKLAAQNPNFVSSIQKLMREQQRYVRDWEGGRRLRIEEQATKRENERASRAAISISGILPQEPFRTPDVEQEELKQFDEKVYRACCQMFESHSAKLKSLGVPFFGVRNDLIMAGDTKLASSTETGPTESSTGTSGKITKRRLLELQREMLKYLMDMYGE
ncbi:hypothetical protein K469DRAFT_365141 [Zopfia rhizophila CBS 207.26]|uniref:Uncharacterized protein n=1 Tax=Zopfia rhizophila CBS 207.26 TaxID=1314779 RepID=A0A6A6EGF0_9PEZI|nr:hypothetical protein K469DRAFT_365141 [Zopfia rhizophila CBS 207.26]